MAGTVIRCVEIAGHFVHAGYDEDVFRTVNQSGYAVAVAVDIHELAVFSDGIGTHEKSVG